MTQKESLTNSEPEQLILTITCLHNNCNLESVNIPIDKKTNDFISKHDLTFAITVKDTLEELYQPTKTTTYKYVEQLFEEP